ncbi:hypothetical protein [Robertkochia sediminum]|uniref:hypothetical protein n=1 Tax=Robertkochia sediminum TaxID=2785326 RepID=UPI001933C376|nr:hypothetical protein [Robertkochia sediminum]MBL7471364.1 hypothetical protein [Robertkochia sediminum]
MNTLSLTTSQQNEFARIFEELKFALKHAYTKESLVILCYKLALEPAHDTAVSKARSMKSLGKGLIHFSKRTVRVTQEKLTKYQNNGWNKEFKSDFNYLNKKLHDSPAYLSKQYDRISSSANTLLVELRNKSKEELIEMICVAVLAVLIFFASAGG